MMLHNIPATQGQPLIDTVRGVFIEGEPRYSGAGFHAKTHFQIAVRNPDCIQGVLHVPPHASL